MTDPIVPPNVRRKSDGKLGWARPVGRSDEARLWSITDEDQFLTCKGTCISDADLLRDFDILGSTPIEEKPTLTADELKLLVEIWCKLVEVYYDTPPTLDSVSATARGVLAKLKEGKSE